MTKRPSSTRRCHMGPPEADICAIARTLAQQFNLTGADSPDALPAECPEPAKVVDALRILLDIIFPGKITSPPDGPSELGVFQLRRLSELWPLLYHQIRRALPYRWLGEAARVQGVRPPKVANLDRETSRILRAFFKTLPAVRELLVQDVQAAYDGDPAAHTYAEVLLAYPGLLAIAAHRLSHELYKLKVPIIPRIMSEWIHTKTGTDIHPGARIGQAFFIDHATGVVIGETTQIGNHVKIYQGVTLGARSFDLDDKGNPVKHIKRHPTIRDQVVIYANATILGGQTVIGARSVIGANVFLMESVPADSIVSSIHPELSIFDKNSTKKT